MTGRDTSEDLRLQDRCTVCNQTRAWHDANKTQHIPAYEGEVPVSLGDSGKKDEKRSSATPAVMRWPFDPVLRQALIDKGVLTVEDLAEAEAKIRVASMVMGGLSGNEPRPASQ